MHVYTGVVMALNIRDKEVDQLAAQLAKARRTTKTQAVKLALRHELDQMGKSLSLEERLRPLQDEVLSYPETGLQADKDFFDSLSDEP
jgi:antitoxin VapB